MTFEKQLRVYLCIPLPKHTNQAVSEQAPCAYYQQLWNLHDQVSCQNLVESKQTLRLLLQATLYYLIKLPKQIACQVNQSPGSVLRFLVQMLIFFLNQRESFTKFLTLYLYHFYQQKQMHLIPQQLRLSNCDSKVYD